MAHHTLTFLILLLSIIPLVTAMRAAHLPRSPSLSELSHHNAYVSSMMQSPVQESFMNHESWHKRKGTPSASNQSDTALAPEIGSVDVVPIPAIAMPALLEASQNTTEDDVPVMEVTPSSALAVHDSSQQVPAGEDWDVATNRACTNALTRVHKIDSPSGMAACYNIRALTTSNASFEADLRIYQVALPTLDWKGVESKDMSVGVRFAGASLEQDKSSSRQKREGKRAVEDRGNVWSGQDGSSWGVMRKVSASAMKPRQIGILHLHGTIDPSTSTNTTLKTALTPSIRLSATKLDGTGLVADLNKTEAFFVVGLSASSSPIDKPKVTEKRMWPPDIRLVIREGNLLEGSQVLPLALGCVCAIVPVVVEGWGIWIRWKWRREWRGKMRRGEGNGVVVVSYY